MRISISFYASDFPFVPIFAHYRHLILNYPVSHLKFENNVLETLALVTLYSFGIRWLIYDRVIWYANKSQRNRNKIFTRNIPS